MEDRLGHILRRLRRRGRGIRALEAAGLGATAAGIVLSGWVLGVLTVGAALTVAIWGVAALALGVFADRFRAALDPPDWSLAAGVIVGALAAGAFLLEWISGSALIPLTLVLAAVAGAAGGLLRRGADLRTIRLADERLGLDERLSAAAELLSDAERRDLLQCLVGQVFACAGERDLRRVSLWRRGAPTVGALVFALLLSVVAFAAMQPEAPTPPNLDALSPTERAELAESLETTGRQAGDEAREALTRSAQAVRVGDAEEFAELLRQLRDKGYRPLEDLPAELLARLSAAGGGEGDPAGATSTTKPKPRAGSLNAEGGLEWVAVWNPDYDPQRPPQAEPSTPRSAAPVRFGDAWRRARAAAMQADRNTLLPPDRQDLVRRFFQ